MNTDYLYKYVNEEGTTYHGANPHHGLDIHNHGQWYSSELTADGKPYWKPIDCPSNWTDRFMPVWIFQESDIGISGSGGIYRLDNNSKENPWPTLKYLVRVVGGYRAFRRLRDAKKYYNEKY